GVSPKPEVDRRSIARQQLLLRLKSLQQQRSAELEKQLLALQSRQAERTAVRQEYLKKKEAARLEAMKRREQLRKERLQEKERRQQELVRVREERKRRQQEEKQAKLVRKVIPPAAVGVSPKPEVDRRSIARQQLLRLLSQARQEHERARLKLTRVTKILERVAPSPVQRPPARKIERKWKKLEENRLRELRRLQLRHQLQFLREKHQAAPVKISPRPAIPAAARPIPAEKPVVLPVKPAIPRPPAIKPVKLSSSLRRQINTLTALTQKQQSLAEAKTRDAEKVLVSLRPLLRRKPALPPVSAVPARPVLVRATAIKPPVPPPALKKQLEQLVKVAQAEQRSALEKVASARKVFPSLLPLLKKKLPEKAARLPAVPTRPAKRYKEPVDWGRLLRRNAFRLVFLLLLLI
ncbi:MAG TPA: hypothetical protein PK644_10690, partial [bacterium]|nr:hypothetical protein [bacterium]